MKILVISDTHGRGDLLGRVLELHSRYDALLFLGDGLRDVDGIVGSYGFSAVRGNCDSFSFTVSYSDAPAERMLCLEGFNILMMHGHTHSVKSGAERAVSYAAAKGADILLYGHTHVRHEEYFPKGELVDGRPLPRAIYVFNPGSLGLSNDGKHSYGIVEIKNGSVLFSHGTV